VRRVTAQRIAPEALQVEEQACKVIQPTWRENPKGKIACWKKGQLRNRLSESGLRDLDDRGKAGLLEV